MAVLNQYYYYRNKTRKYMSLVKDAAAAIISAMDKKKSIRLETYDMENLVSNIFYNLKRITNSLDNEKSVRGGDLISINDEINLVKCEIEKDILDEINRRGFNVNCKDGSIKIVKQK